MRSGALLIFAENGILGYPAPTMPEYRRLTTPGATYFFTVVTNFRRPILAAPAALGFLRTAFREERNHHPFEIDAIVVLPDHLHCLWILPPDDTRYSMRWSAIKGRFTDLFLAAGGRETPLSTSRRQRGNAASGSAGFGSTSSVTMTTMDGIWITSTTTLSNMV